MKIAVILPAYNEEQTIDGTIRGFSRILPDAEFWVINNRSTDATAAVAENTISAVGCAGGVIHEFRPGKGSAVRRAFLELEADIYVLVDADLTYPAGRISELIRPVADGRADMVVGDRHSLGYYSSENKRPMHEFGNKLVCGLVNKLFNANLKDIMSGYRVLSRRFVKTYPVMAEGFELETDVTVHALDKRFRIIEIPVEYRDRPDGSFSKLNTIRDGIRVVVTIFNILRYYRPMMFFGSLAAIFSCVGLLASVPVIQDWILEKYIHHIPLAILATGLEISAIVLLAIALILDSIAQKDKRNFEREVLALAKLRK